MMKFKAIGHCYKVKDMKILRQAKQLIWREELQESKTYMLKNSIIIADARYWSRTSPFVFSSWRELNNKRVTYG